MNTPSVPPIALAGDRVREFEELCDLIPDDAHWGMPLTPDLVRHIRASIAAPTPSASSVPSFEAKHVSTKMKGETIVLTLELKGLEGAPQYLVTPINPAAVRAAPANPAPSVLTYFEVGTTERGSALNTAMKEADTSGFTRGQFQWCSVFADALVRALLQANGATK